MTAPHTTTANSPPDRKPRDEEIDVYGVTHRGKVRAENQDHFLISSLRKQMAVRMTSLPDVEQLIANPERLASLAMVADGVGGGTRGADASRMAVEAVAKYVSSSMRCYYTADPANDQSFSEALEEGALRCHSELVKRGEQNPEYQGMSTTLTLYLGVWPRAYLLQVGDSRCYLLRDGELTQITRDQTMAQDLIDLGVLTRADASRSRFAHTLSSSIGGSQTAPVISRFNMAWGNVLLLCSDGLTHHVSDERIRERLTSMTSAKQVCEDLLREAMDAGGTDNITIIVGRAMPKET
ncbi:MAG TPA: protein phosphatase 2C domain-containing protein [Gemmatimonadales bacterium]|nr:protein phosphatase 2C domain-containing protein [Gemmatimonadales bacterium]